MAEDVLQGLKDADKVVGLKQVLRGLKEGSLRCVLVANDADTFLFSRVTEAAAAANVPVTRVPAMKELGKAAGVAVAAATVGLKR